MDSLQVDAQVDYKEIIGYKELPTKQKEYFKKFLNNFYFTQGAKAIKPIEVGFMEEIEDFLFTADGEEKVVGNKLYAIQDGERKLINEWGNEIKKEKYKTRKRNFLCFVVEMDGKKEWYHVTGERDWW